MNKNIEVLFLVRSITKLYEKLSESVCETFDLTRFEMDVIAFLSNNPSMDTASDIIEFRRLPKSNVSQAVEKLIQKELLIRIPDQKDRRRVHLSLTPAAAPIIKGIHAMQSDFNNKLFDGFSEASLDLFSQMSNQISKNVVECLEGK